MCKRLLILFTLVMGVRSVHAQEPLSPDLAVVARLYQDFAWEAVVREPRPRQPTFTQQPKEVLLQYLDPSLVRLLLVDRACAVKSRMVCNLDFAPLWASQDPTGASLRIQPGKREGVVEVSLLYACSEKTSLRFEVIETPLGARIRDIYYPSGTSLQAILNRRL